MQGHDILVVGASAGGLKALTSIVRDLPPDLPAAIFVVQHIHASHPSILPEILTDVGSLPAHHARDGEPIRLGRIYVAPPDHHLLLRGSGVSVVRGPQENRFRPSVDVLFRSAARSYGPRVIGLVLTGALDDGTIGLQAIKARGGMTAVQDPSEAEFPSMPSSAIRFARPDYTLPLSEIPDFLSRMTREPAGQANPVHLPPELDVEVRIAEQELQGPELMEIMDGIGTRTSYTCPGCGGSLWQIGSDDPLRFRCHTGHGFTQDALITGQSEQLDWALWSAVRLLEEKASLHIQLARRRKAQGDPSDAAAHERSVELLQRAVRPIREILLGGEPAPELSEETAPVVPESEAYR